MVLHPGCSARRAARYGRAAGEPAHRVSTRLGPPCTTRSWAGGWLAGRWATGARARADARAGRQARVLGQQLARCRPLGGHRGAVLAPGALVAAIRHRLEGRDQVVLAIADQVGPAHGLERLAQQGPVVRVVVAQEGLVQAAALLPAHNVHGFFSCIAHLAPHPRQRVAAGVVHGRGRGHGAGIEGLHLVCAEAVLLEPDGEVHHVLVAGARMRGDEVRDQELLLARLFAELLEHLLEAVIAADARLHHLGERALLGVLWRDLQVAPHMVLHQFPDVFGRLHGQVVAQARADEDLLDALERPAPAVDLDERAVVGGEVLADARIDAAGLAAGGLDLGAAAAQAVHVGRGAAQVGDGAGEPLDLVADVLDLLDDRVFAAALDDAALVLGDRAERAAAEAAAHDVHAEADHLPRGDLRRPVVAAILVGIAGMRAAGIRQVEDMVHLGRGERDGRRVDPHVARRGTLTVRLHQRAGVAGIGFQVQHAVSVRIEHRVALDLLIAGQPDDALFARGHFQPGLERRIRDELDRLDRGVRILRCGSALLLAAAAALCSRLLAGREVGIHMGLDTARLIDRGGVDLEPAGSRLVAGTAHEGGAAHVGDLLDRLARGQAMRHLDQRTLGVAVQQQVAFGIDHDGAAHLVAPVIVVGNAAEAAFDAAQDDGHVLERLAAALAVHDRSAVGTLAPYVARGVGVVAADLPVGRVPVDHGIHVARRHAPEQVGTAQRLEGLGALPVGLGDDADTKALRLQRAADHRHAEARMIDVGVARDQDHVAAVPAQLLHLLAAHGQERGRAEALRPIGAIARQRLGGAREKGNVDRGVHSVWRGGGPWILEGSPWKRPGLCRPPRSRWGYTVIRTLPYFRKNCKSFLPKMSIKIIKIIFFKLSNNLSQRSPIAKARHPSTETSPCAKPL